MVAKFSATYGCDNCGNQEEAHDEMPREFPALPPGWRRINERDYCRRCIPR